jgi:hypothetical protein
VSILTLHNKIALLQLCKTLVYKIVFLAVPGRDSISRPSAPVSSVAVRDDTIRYVDHPATRHQEDNLEIAFGAKDRGFETPPGCEVL